jgi:hypothetical protein
MILKKRYALPMSLTLCAFFLTACHNNSDQVTQPSVSPELQQSAAVALPTKNLAEASTSAQQPTSVVVNDTDVRATTSAVQILEAVPTPKPIPSDGKNSKRTESPKEIKEAAKTTLTIPEGWEIISVWMDKTGVVQGDLNNDGKNDQAVVLQEKLTADNAGTPLKRRLLVGLTQKDGSLKEVIQSETAIMLANEGGVFGDPFNGLEIKNGILSLSFYGGSNWRWYSTYQFRFQNNDFYLIGAKIGSYFTGNDKENEEKEYQLLTGDVISSEADENGKMITTTSKREKKPLLKLSEFDPRDAESKF